MKLIKRRREGEQNVSYSLTEELGSLKEVPEEDLKKWVDSMQNSEGLPEKFRARKINKDEFLGRMSEMALDKKTVKDLSDCLSLSLFELKTFIDYELKANSYESYETFWKFVGNPLYRMHLQSVADDCRHSEEYRKRLFEKIDLLVNELRSDRELYRQREERKKKGFQR
jgi:hypothetical protein